MATVFRHDANMIGGRDQRCETRVAAVSAGSFLRNRMRRLQNPTMTRMTTVKLTFL